MAHDTNFQSFDKKNEDPKKKHQGQQGKMKQNEEEKEKEMAGGMRGDDMEMEDDKNAM